VQRSAYTISSATASPAATARNGRAKMNMPATVGPALAAKNKLITNLLFENSLQ
jgi:hypothetical protein